MLVYKVNKIIILMYKYIWIKISLLKSAIPLIDSGHGLMSLLLLNRVSIDSYIIYYKLIILY